MAAKKKEKKGGTNETFSVEVTFSTNGFNLILHPIGELGESAKAKIMKRREESLVFSTTIRDQGTTLIIECIPNAKLIRHS